MRWSEVARGMAILSFFGALMAAFLWLLTLNEEPTVFNLLGARIGLVLFAGTVVLFGLSEWSYRREPHEPATAAPAPTPSPPPGAVGASEPAALGDLVTLRDREQGAYEAFVERIRATLTWADRQLAFLRSEVATQKRRADGMKGVAETAVKALEEETAKRKQLETRAAADTVRIRELAAEVDQLKRDAGLRANPEGFDDETLRRLQDEIRRLTSGRSD